MTGLSTSETALLTDVIVKSAAAAFVGPEAIAEEWRALNFTDAPDFSRALSEYEQLLALVRQTGATVRQLPRGTDVGMDSIYVRDASVVTPAGLVLCRMGKRLRDGEPEAQRQAFVEWGLPIAGAIEPPGQLEGGDVVWLDARTVAVGRGYRTNDAGIAQLAGILGSAFDVISVPLPHWRGPSDVFHLMSILSPVDRDLALVYAPLVPVPFLERLVSMGYGLVEVPDEEFDTMGANVLALAPRKVIALDGNPHTRDRLEVAGVEVHVYGGNEISIKGGGGPTCLTRPIGRRA